MYDVVIVGAGIAGLSAALHLQDTGAEVVVIEKSRGVGGRMATRRDGQARFDHGAQAFEARDPRFKEIVDRWLSDGTVRVWLSSDYVNRWVPEDRSDWYVGVGGMNAAARQLAAGLQVLPEWKVERVSLRGSSFRLVNSVGKSVVGRRLIMTPPVPQSLALLKQGRVALPGDLREALSDISYRRCLTAMLVFGSEDLLPEIGMIDTPTADIIWMADNRQKGTSSEVATLTVHTSTDFAESHWDHTEDQIVRVILDAVPVRLPSPLSYRVHRWRYATPHKGCPERFLSTTTSSGASLYFCGDAFGHEVHSVHGLVERAALSGLAVGDAVGQEFAATTMS